MKRVRSKYDSEFNFVIQAKRKDSANFEDTVYGGNSIEFAQNKIIDLRQNKTFNSSTRFRIVMAKNFPVKK